MMLIAEKEMLKKVKSLQLKKFRAQHHAFVIEGPKLLNEFITANANILQIFGTQDFFNANNYENIDCFTVNEKQLKSISTLKKPNQVVAVVEQFKTPKTNLNEGFHLVLDNIKDPGNLGTIIRIADWFDFDSVILSPETVDEYNPKVIQSSMGSLARVNILRNQISTIKTSLPIYATSLTGESIYMQEIDKKSAVIIIGSESHGIGADSLKLADKFIKIPLYGNAESLNAAVATGIVCAEFRR